MHRPQSQKFKLPSGAELSVSTADFSSASALLKALLRSLQKGGADMAGVKESIAGLKNDPAAMASLLERVVSVATSDEVEAAVFKCLEWATYKAPGSAEQKVTRAIFDDPAVADEARADYFTMAFRVAEVNCAPFFKATFSGLLKARQQAPSAAHATN